MTNSPADGRIVQFNSAKYTQLLLAQLGISLQFQQLIEALYIPCLTFRVNNPILNSFRDFVRTFR